MKPSEPRIVRCAVYKNSVLVQFAHVPSRPDQMHVDIFHYDTGMQVRDPKTKFDKVLCALVTATADLKDDILVRVSSSSTKEVLFDQVLTVPSVRDVPIDADDDPSPTKRTARAVEDSISYAVLTKGVDGNTGTGPANRLGGLDGGSAQLIGQTLRDVLGWKVRDDDPKGFSGALTASFSVADVEGHTQWSWTPRTYAVQTDLSGGITGAQASLYTRAQEALTQSLPLLDKLYPLQPDADNEDIAAVKAVLRRQLDELVGELGAPGGPGVTRVERYFNLLLASPNSTYDNNGTVQTPDPDDVKGTLGRLRDVLGLRSSDNLVNSVADEQNQTDYRVFADYLTSLAQSWLNNQKFFKFNTETPFLGTQLVPISKQLSLINESVDDLRFTLDSVFIGAAERQTLVLNFGTGIEPMYAEDFFRWIQNFVTEEAPSYIQDGGKFGIGNSLVPFAKQFQKMTHALLTAKANNQLPEGFRTKRVQRSIESLEKALQELVRLASPLTRDFSIQPTPAQLLASTTKDRLAALNGVLYFVGGKNLPLSTVLHNLSDSELFVTFAPLNGVDVTFPDHLPGDVTVTSIPAGESVQAMIHVDGAIATDDLHFIGWFRNADVRAKKPDADVFVTLIQV